MHDGELGYDAARMSALDTKAQAAITALRAITSSDPSARRAIGAVDALRSTLETRWMPAIRAIRSSDALTGGFTTAALGGGAKAWGGGGPHDELNYCPFDALAMLFPGDDDVTAEDIATEIDEILRMAPSQEQFAKLNLLGRAFEQIADDADLAAAVIEELGSEGLRNAYTELFMLGLEYPHDIHRDGSRVIGDDIATTIGTPFNLVVGAATERPEGRRVVARAIDELADADDAWDVAAVAGLARVEGLGPNLARSLLEVIEDLDPTQFHAGWGDLDNTMYPEIEWDFTDLRLFVIANNPVLIHDLIHDHHDFVDGGEEQLRDLIETNGYYWRTDEAIGELLGKVFAHIIEHTPPDELVHSLPSGRPATTGVIFDLVDLLLEQDLKVPGHHVLAAIGPLLPEVMGAVPGSSRRYSPDELRSILKDLFEDLSSSQVEEAMAIIITAAVDEAPISITSADFSGPFPAGNPVGDYLDAIFGPASGALDDVIDDRNKQAEMWRSVLTDAFGLIPLPGSTVVKFAIKRGVNEIINGTINHDRANGRDRSALDEAQQQLIENTIVVLYDDPAISAQVVDNALADWEDTAIALGGDLDDVRNQGGGGQRTSAAEVERIRRELLDAQRNGTPIPADIFMQMPQIQDLVNQLEDELILSPERARGD